MKVEILVVEGNSQSLTEALQAMGGCAFGPDYAALLESFDERIACTVMYPSEEGTDCLPKGKTFADYQGIVWTGSSLNAHDLVPEVIRQLEVARMAYASGTPVFGSCWGMQIVACALGATVRKNSKGRELTIGRIALSEAGKAHPMYCGKEAVFDAIQVHEDEVDIESLPEGSILLAGNDMSRVQAMSIEEGDCSFWGVQYHPEFDFAIMAIELKALKPSLIEDGLYTEQEIEAIIAEYSNTGKDASSDDSVNDPKLRRLEIINWLRTKVLDY